MNEQQSCVGMRDDEVLTAIYNLRCLLYYYQYEVPGIIITRYYLLPGYYLICFSFASTSTQELLNLLLFNRVG